MEWVKANGGPLAVVFLGVGIGGFTYPPVGIGLVILGLVWLVVTMIQAEQQRVSRAHRPTRPRPRLNRLRSARRA